MNKRNSWNLSFYTDKDHVDVSKIAASLGGGGHMRAAGASSLKELPEFLRRGTKTDLKNKALPPYIRHSSVLI